MSLTSDDRSHTADDRSEALLFWFSVHVVMKQNTSFLTNKGVEPNYGISWAFPDANLSVHSSSKSV